MGCCFSSRDGPDELRALLSYSRQHWLNISEADYPAPFPPRNRRCDLYPREFYLEADSSVTKVPKRKLKTLIADLAEFLVRNCTTDVECARALFRYVACTDVNQLLDKFDADYVQDSGLDYFSRMSSHTCNHALLYKTLCQAVGVPCVIIDGIAKNSDYEIGGQIDSKGMRHQWNAVYIDNQWRLVDVLWGSACMIGERSAKWSVINVDGEGINQKEKASQGKKCRLRNDFFFLTDPDMLICTHLPDNRDWQLLPHAVTFQQFEEFVYIREQFFKIGLMMHQDSHQLCNIQSSDGEVSIIFGIPSKKANSLLFKYLLFYKTNGKDVPVSNFDNIILFEETDDTVCFQVFLPFSGKFRFEAFCCEDKDVHQRFDLVFAYIIHCSMPKQDFSGLPITPQIGWGPGVEAKRAGLAPISHRGATMHTMGGQAIVTFDSKKKYDVYCQLKSNDYSDSELQQCLIRYFVNGELKIDFRLPDSGQFALSLFASNNEKPDAAPNVCNYLLKNNTPVSNLPYPRTHEGSIGCNRYESHHMGVTCGEEGAIIHIKTVPFVLTFDCDEQTEILASLDHVDLRPSDLAKCVKYSRENEITTVQLTLKVIGEYALSIYARKPNEKRLHHIHTYLILNRTDGKQKKASTVQRPMDKVRTINTLQERVQINRVKEKRHVVFLYRRCTIQGRADQAEFIIDDDDVITLDLTHISDYTFDEFAILREGCLEHVRSHRLRRLVEDKKPLGQNQRGSLFPEPESTPQKVYSLQLLRTLLKVALASNCPKLIEPAIDRIKNSFYENRVPELKRAERKLDVIATKRELSNAIMTRSRSIPVLQSVIDKIDSKRYAQDMGMQLTIARTLLDKGLKDKIGKMNQGTIAEVKSYKAPPEVVKSVMAASFVLLGQEEQEVNDWDNIKKMIGDTYKMKSKLKDRTVSSISPEKIEQAKQILAEIEGSKVQKVSEVASTFFAWSKNMLKMASNPEEGEQSQSRSETQASDEHPLSVHFENEKL